MVDPGSRNARTEAVLIPNDDDDGSDGKQRERGATTARVAIRSKDRERGRSGCCCLTLFLSALACAPFVDTGCGIGLRPLRDDSRVCHQSAVDTHFLMAREKCKIKGGIEARH